MLGKFFGRKKSAQLVIPVHSTLNDLHPPIGGPHPVLNFTTQITKKYCTAMCFSKRMVSRYIWHTVGTKQGLGNSTPLCHQFHPKESV